MNLKDSKTDGTLAVGVECVAGIEARLQQGCRLGCEDCSLCMYLVFKNVGEVVPHPEPDTIVKVVNDALMKNGVIRKTIKGIK